VLLNKGADIIKNPFGFTPCLSVYQNFKQLLLHLYIYIYYMYTNNQ